MLVFPLVRHAGWSGLTYSGDFNGSSSYCTWTPSGAPTSETVYTLGAWWKQDTTAVARAMMSAGSDANNEERLYLRESGSHTDRFNAFLNVAGANKYNKLSTPTYTDTAGWHHVALIRNGATLNIYIDGSEPAYTTDTNPGASDVARFGKQSVAIEIGRSILASSYWDGHLAGVIYLDGTAASIGALYDAGAMPDPGALTYGNNGFCILDPSTGVDTSGNGNDFSVTSVTQTADVP